MADLSRWCEQCGEPTGAVRQDHRDCGERAALEPPRYCGRCRRRMVVQVLPLGWSARCGQHGTRTG